MVLERIGKPCTFLAIVMVLLLPNMAGASPGDVQATQLSGEEILQAFSDVRDEAEVQDAVNTSAINYWYADGRFTNSWNNGTDSGEITGSWRVDNDQRCVTISTGLPQRVGGEICSPVFRRGSKYLSFNSDGSIHGIHTLTPLLKLSQ